ncbi:TonB-dependent receptor [Taibaiella soli]|uniref:TonB-dependent receptor n=1 Tax=Taibaiella soli TaxID=1649169 RepID=A0A2W2ATM6_9BACT|nr:TonB-dependent receptor [Taibaiella soli]PZF71058.1 TonB-dependent receptor [Taibaiella soli]
MKKLILLIAISFAAQTLWAQATFKAVVEDKSTHETLAGVSVVVKGNETVGNSSDVNGKLVLSNLPEGKLTLQCNFVGYKKLDVDIVLPDTSTHVIFLEPDEATLNEVVVVSSTRNNDRIENATTKVEVLGSEEMSEESMVKPGNISSILGDVSGIQIQQSSATSGNANVRILGLDGKYTQMLKDGMPLYDGYSGGFGVLSIQPLDLKQVELIKGSASTLYGGGAIGGLINFISKKPTYEPDASFILNGTTLKEGNLNGYFAQRWKKIGFTLFAGQTMQKQVDVDGDGLSDVPKISSTSIHPTLFLYPTDKSTISIGWAGNYEKRTGGDMLAIDNANDAAHPYYDKNDLKRNTYTMIATNNFTSRITGTLKGSLSVFDRTETTNTYLFKAQQKNFYSEASLAIHLDRHNIVGGVNITGDDFRPDASTPAPVGNFSNTVQGIFGQDTWQLLKNTKLEGGLRVDHHTQYGMFVLPRLALFQKINEAWGVRAGFGMGYKTPNPLSPQIKDYEIYQIMPIPSGVTPEKSTGGNIEFNYKKAFGDGDEKNSFFINHAFFMTQINNPVVGTEQPNGDLTFSNGSKPIVTRGFDTYVQLKMAPWEFYVGYTYTDAIRKYLADNQYMPLTPRNRAAATAVYEIEGKWRFGLEASYNGTQYRDGDTKTPDYVFMATMIERKFGKKWSVVLNCENLLDVRQTKYETIYTGSIMNPDYKPLWAPIDGRVVNLAIKFMPFAH